MNAERMEVLSIIDGSPLHAEISLAGYGEPASMWGGLLNEEALWIDDEDVEVTLYRWVSLHSCYAGGESVIRLGEPRVVRAHLLTIWSMSRKYTDPTKKRTSTG